MSIALIVTGGYGNGTFSGSIAHITVWGYLARVFCKHILNKTDVTLTSDRDKLHNANLVIETQEGVKC